MDSKESIPPGYIGWRADTATRFQAPIACSKIPAVIERVLNSDKLKVDETGSRIHEHTIFVAVFG
jgi:hypothetical protein